MLELTNLVHPGETSRFPFVWLRDNCICPDCFHAKSSSRLTAFSRLDLDDIIAKAELTNAAVRDTRLGRATAEHSAGPALAPATECVRIDWASGHESVFPLRWLEERCFSKRRREMRSRDMDPFALLEASGVALGSNDADVRRTAKPIAGAREGQAREIPRFSFDELTRPESHDGC